MADYADIVQIVAPAKALAGQPVDVEVRVKNLADYGFYVSVTGVFDGTEISFSPGYTGIDAGATVSFYGSFTMPSGRVTITAYSFYWTGSDWQQDDLMTKTVELDSAAPSEFGEIEIVAYARR